MKTAVVALPGAEAFGGRIATLLEAVFARLESRRFPDGEIYLRVVDDIVDCDVLVVAQLRDPDPQFAGLLFLADALRELGARSVGLVAPYLPYMRQDRRFLPGEAVTSSSFAKLVSIAFDWLVTVDPHLHRHGTLAEIYGIPTRVVASAPAIAAWLQGQVVEPYLIGPDEESAQWVREVAVLAGCPYTVMKKHRLGDRKVEFDKPDLSVLGGHTPVFIDDIIASAQTLARAIETLRSAGGSAPVCVGVHAVFAGDALALLQAAGAAVIASCNTLLHPSNAIDISTAVAAAVRLEIEALVVNRPSSSLTTPLSPGADQAAP